MPVEPVPITARSVVCALGRTRAEVVAALDAGRSGLRPLPDDLRTALRMPPGLVAGAVQGELPPLPPELAAWDTRTARLLALALDEVRPAVRAAIERYGAGRVAVVLGSSTAGIERTERAHAAWVRSGRLPADFDLERQHAFGALLDVTRALTGLEGPGWVVSTACSSSAKVLADGRRLLAAGVADAVLVGGVDSLCRTTLRGFAGLEVLSPTACRPFSAGRDGITIGEGAALLLLEREGASSAPLLLGVGESADAHHATAPHPEGAGARRAFEAALAEAGLAPGDVDHVNAHGTGTAQNDAVEARALRDVFGAHRPAVASTKGATGHLLGAAGAVEAVLALEALERGRVPASLGAEPVDPALGIDVATTTRSAPLRAALSASFAFGGSNAVVALGRSSSTARASHASTTTRLALDARPELIAEVAGLGLWMPGVPSVAHFLEGRRDESAREPAASALGPRLKRRTSLLVKLAAEVAGQAAGDALGRVPSIYASAWGELGTTVQILEQLAAAPAGASADVSPLAFSSSVQNTAAGLISIATGNRAPSTTIAAGRSTVAMAVLAALSFLAAHPGEVLLVLADEPVPSPFARPGLAAPALGVALLLRTPSRPSAIRIARPRRLDAPRGAGEASPALDLLRALATGDVRGDVALEPGERPWGVEVLP